MSAIARYCRHAGLNVSGYDRTPSHVTEALEKEGIPVHFDSNVSLIPPVREHGYRIVKRAEALGEITSGKRCLAVSGTHGKTTTSTMLAHILAESGEGCTAFLGGISKNYGTNLLLGDNDVIVAEADEFDRSFLHLHPEAAVVTSMDADHLDIYSDIEDLRRTFVQFGLQTDRYLVIKKGLEERFRSAGVRADILTYGEGGDFHASDIVSDGTGRMYFTLNTPSGAFRDFHAGVPGLVYIENATAAAAMAMLHGVHVDSIRKAISTFSGVVRRFDIRLNIPGHTYIDDYAHHPAELAATITSIRQIWPGRRICGIFQPHLYSRTKDFYPEFASSLSLLDSVILLPIYPAREEPIPGVSSDMILDRINLSDKKIVEKQDLLAEIGDRDTDILVTFGAGDIDRFVTPIESLLKEKYA